MYGTTVGGVLQELGVNWGFSRVAVGILGAPLLFDGRAEDEPRTFPWEPHHSPDDPIRGWFNSREQKETALSKPNINVSPGLLRCRLVVFPPLV